MDGDKCDAVGIGDGHVGGDDGITSAMDVSVEI